MISDGVSESAGATQVAGATPTGPSVPDGRAGGHSALPVIGPLGPGRAPLLGSPITSLGSRRFIYARSTIYNFTPPPPPLIPPLYAQIIRSPWARVHNVVARQGESRSLHKEPSAHPADRSLTRWVSMGLRSVWTEDAYPNDK